MSLDYPRLLADLQAESDELTRRLQGLDGNRWALETPARGWSIQDQVSHLAFFDDAAVLALTRPDEFGTQAAALIAGGMDFPDRLAEQYRSLAPMASLQWFREARRTLLATLGTDDPKRRIPWFGPDMSVASCATARLMETWAHGHDIYDTVHTPHPASPGLRSIAHLGVATFAFSHIHHGLDVPTEPVRIELRAPSGAQWEWGPSDADDTVSGDAEDFVLVVTQRRHWTETGLAVRGPVAAGWLDIAQAYAGAASRRSPGAVQR